MKKLLKALWVETGGYGRGKTISMVKRYLPGKVVFKIFGKGWYIGDMISGIFEPADKPACWDAPGLSAIEDFISFAEGRGFVMRDGCWRMIDERGGETALEELGKKVKIWPFCHGFARFKEDGCYGFIRRDGEIAVEAVYENASDYNDGLAFVKKHSRVQNTGYINALGKRVNRAQAKALDDERKGGSGLNVLKIGGMPGLHINMTPDGRCELVDEKGTHVRFKEWKAVWKVSCTLALVQNWEGRFGYIDCDNNVKIEPAYDVARSFCCGTALVKKDGVWSVIDTDGRDLGLSFRDVMNVRDHASLAVLETQNGSYIFDHRFYEDDKGFFPADEPVVLCSPETFLRADEPGMLFASGQPEQEEYFRLIAYDCEAVQRAIKAYARHLERCYALRITRRTLDDGEALLFSQEIPSSLHAEEPALGRNVLELMVSSEIVCAGRHRGEKKCILSVRACGQECGKTPVHFIDDGKRGITCDDPELSQPPETVQHFYTNVVWSRLEPLYRKAAENMGLQMIKIYALIDPRPGHEHCNTVDVAGRRCCGVIWCYDEAGPCESDEVIACYSREFKLD